MTAGRRMTGARLVRSELTGRVYVVTAWTQNPDGTIVASKKLDVTDQFEPLALAYVATLADEEPVA